MGPKAWERIAERSKKVAFSGERLTLSLSLPFPIPFCIGKRSPYIKAWEVTHLEIIQKPKGRERERWLPMTSIALAQSSSFCCCLCSCSFLLVSSFYTFFIISCNKKRYYIILTIILLSQCRIISSHSLSLLNFY